MELMARIMTFGLCKTPCWLQVYAQSPGAQMFLVCTRAGSPPEGFDREDWTAHVGDVAEAVHSKVEAHA